MDSPWKTPMELIKINRAGDAPCPFNEKSMKFRTLRIFDSNDATARSKLTLQASQNISAEVEVRNRAMSAHHYG